VEKNLAGGRMGNIKGGKITGGGARGLVFCFKNLVG